MSLKTFHFLFIIFAIVFSFGFAFWAFAKPEDAYDVPLRLPATIALVIGVACLIYLPFFLRKSRKIID
jgi:membrane protease YdiL (CAAX protease family)